MSQYPPPYQQQPPQWDPRYGPPPQTYAPPYYTPGHHGVPAFVQRSGGLAIVGLGALAGLLSGLLLALPASFAFSVFVDGVSLQDLQRSQLDPPLNISLPIPFIFYSLLLSALHGIAIALPRLGMAARAAYIPLAIVLGTLIGVIIDISIVEPLTGVFNLDKAPIDWLRLLSYNLPLALGASLFVGLATR